ncbi:beta-1,3-galactosyltransferase 1-like [Ixodes scapularis]|nr:beta-1,3-galactosyltransferase 1-like [Ixodes scapularis]
MAAGTSNEDAFIVVVHSAPHHFRLRATIRETWARDARFPLSDGRRAVVVFVMGKPAVSPNYYEFQIKIASEAAVHKDIVQGTFTGSYTSVTLLNILMLKWASLSCPQASYLVKVADDTFVNMKYMRDVFQDVVFKTSVIYAHVYRKPSVWNGHKLNVIKETICVSCGYAVSMDVVPRLFSLSIHGSLSSMEGLFWNASQDRMSPVSVINMRGFSSLRGGKATGCDMRKAITSHQLEVEDMLRLWKDLQNKTEHCNVSQSPFNLI